MRKMEEIVYLWGKSEKQLFKKIISNSELKEMNLIKNIRVS